MKFMCQHIVSAMLPLPINQTGGNLLDRTICCGENHSSAPFCVPALFYLQCKSISFNLILYLLNMLLTTPRYAHTRFY